MGDIGDIWNAFEKSVVPHIRATRQTRVAKYHRNLREICEFAEAYGTSIRTCSDQHIQFRCLDFVANYYPSTRKLFFQKPTLTPTLTSVAPEEVLRVFLREARKIEIDAKASFASWWEFHNNQSPPDEVIQIGEYMMSHVRKELLRLASRRWDIIEQITPRAFEELIEKLFIDMGYTTTLTPSSHDGGKDIIAITRHDGKEFVVFVECKRWITANVGIEIVQRAVGVRYIENANHSMIVTTADFTKPAQMEAKKVTKELTLVDGNLLKKWVSQYNTIKTKRPLGEVGRENTQNVNEGE